MRNSIKTAIALAIATIGIQAHAQSNVQVYGVADVSAEVVRSSGVGSTGTELGNRTRIQSNSSHVGFRGSEDLGNGLKAVFQIETGVNMDDAGGSTFGGGRDTFVGLSSNYGTVAAGYLSHPYRSTLTGMDVVPGAAGVANINGIMGKLNNVNLAVRTQAVAYISPNFNGFKGSIAYTGNEDREAKNVANAENPNGVSLNLGYENGPYKAVYAHTTARDTFNADAVVQGHLFGGAYSFGQGTTIGAVYETIKEDQAGSAYDKRNAWGLNAKHVMGQHEFAAAYYNAGNVKTAAGDIADSKATQVALRYGYNLSKRTQVYGVYSQLNNGSAAAYDFGGGTGIEKSAPTGNDQRALGVGMRHSF